MRREKREREERDERHQGREKTEEKRQTGEEELCVSGRCQALRLSMAWTLVAPLYCRLCSIMLHTAAYAT